MKMIRSTLKYFTTKIIQPCVKTVSCRGRTPIYQTIFIKIRYFTAIQTRVGGPLILK